MTEVLKHIRNIYYRGSLDTCNYTCSYCPFGKKGKRKNLSVDKKEFLQFCNAIESYSFQNLRIFLIPYGEALIHSYYQEGMIHIAKLSSVKEVGCQTNLSFPVEPFIKEIRKEQVNPTRINIWATFHPEMESPEVFAGKINFLKEEGINVSAGTVGNPDNYLSIRLLRDKLHPGIYLFINHMEGRKKSLEQKDIRRFREIDHLYEFDRKNCRAEFSRCRGKENTAFINGKGDLYPCVRNPTKTGNLYNGEYSLTTACHKKRCDCFLAYSNLKDHPVNHYLGNGVFWRIPEKHTIKAAFFDIDGTLTDNKGHLQENYQKTLQYLSAHIPLFLATALPIAYARARLGKFLNLFKGGIFADGGHILYENKNEYISISNTPSFDRNIYNIQLHTAENIIFKYSIMAPTKDDAILLKESLNESCYNLFHKGRLVTITDIKATKKAGLITLCRKEKIEIKDVLAIGDSMYDWPMLSIVGYPCAVLSAEKSLQEKVQFVLNPDQIPNFFGY